MTTGLSSAEATIAVQVTPFFIEGPPAGYVQISEPVLDHSCRRTGSPRTALPSEIK
jgi:hypothetical protein